MVRNDIEEVVHELQRTVEIQAKKIQRLEDIHEIQNLMTKYEAFHTAGKHDEVVKMFALKTPGVRVDIPHFGFYEGPEGVKRSWIAHKYVERDRRGQLHVHAISAPFIEVSGDGKTAKGIWTSPGILTMPIGDKFTANWSWCKYGIDFVKEDGVWKFWHFRSFGLFSTPFNKSWVEEGPEPALPLPDELKPDRRPSPYYTYKTTVPAPYEPVLPEPFETFDEVEAY